MDIYDVLTMVGGLCLFLFGMNIMGESLERAAGSSLRSLLGKLTTNRMLGFLTGMAVTAVIQSSSATTVMVVGFVNSGLLSLGQAINVIMGANVGTTVTAWVLSLSGVEGDSLLIQLRHPCFQRIACLVQILIFSSKHFQFLLLFFIESKIRVFAIRYDLIIAIGGNGCIRIRSRTYQRESCRQDQQQAGGSGQQKFPGDVPLLAGFQHGFLGLADGIQKIVFIHRGKSSFRRHSRSLCRVRDRQSRTLVSFMPYRAAMSLWLSM